MRVSSAHHVFAVAVIALALVDGGSVHARGGPPQPLSAAAIERAVCSDAVPPRRAAMFKAEVLLDRLDLSPGVVDAKRSENAENAVRTGALEDSHSLSQVA